MVENHNDGANFHPQTFSDSHTMAWHDHSKRFEGSTSPQKKENRLWLFAIVGDVGEPPNVAGNGEDYKTPMLYFVTPWIVHPKRSHPWKETRKKRVRYFGRPWSQPKKVLMGGENGKTTCNEGRFAPDFPPAIHGLIVRKELAAQNNIEARKRQ
jgi:hypothetical protein